MPEPAAALVIVIHDVAVVALQVQPSSAVTATVPDPPPAGRLDVTGLIEYVHVVDCDVPSWRMFTTRPPIAMVVERGSGSTQDKITRLREAGIVVVDNPNEIPARLREFKEQGKLRVK